MSIGSFLDSTLGALFLATIASAFLFGITCLQVYLYYQWYPKDGWLNKTFVALLWVLDSCTLAFTIHLSYRYFVTDFGQLLALADFGWDIKAQALTTAIVAPTVQSMYARRVWKLSGNNKLIPMVLFAALIACWVTVILSIRAVFSMNNLLEEVDVNKIFLAGLPISGATDIFISLSLSYFFYRPQKTFAATESLLQNLMLWVIGTGALTSIGTVVVLVTYVAMPGKIVFYAVDIIVSKIYINGFLVMLNIRRSLRSNSMTNVFVLPDTRGQASAGASLERTLDTSQQKPSPANTVEYSLDSRAYAV